MPENRKRPDAIEGFHERLLAADSPQHRRRRPKKVARAALVILTAREGKDPYLIDNHSSIERGNAFDCPEESIWDRDSDIEQLIPIEILSETEAAPGFGILECPACAHDYDLWDKIIDAAGVQYGHRVFKALSLEQYIKDFGADWSEISLEEWEDLQTVRRIIHQVDEHARYEQGKTK